LEPYAETFASFWRDVDEQLRPFQNRSGNSWRWAEEYQDPRNEAILLLDILAYVSGEAVSVELRKATTLRDPLLVMAASITLLRRAEAVDPDSLYFVASCDETRNRWKLALQELDLLYLFPSEFGDEESQARGRLVEWLIHPTEWECAPDDIELLDIVGDVYLFQFRTRLGYHWSSDQGWVAGIANSQYAFSDFQPAALVATEEHVRRMLNQGDVTDK
jgi:hypothetical protein